MDDEGFLEELFGLRDQVAVVTGGGGVLCSRVSLALAQAGAEVAVLDIDGASAARVASEIEARGRIAKAIPTDVLDRNSLETALRQVLDRFGRVDILINGAGGNRQKATTSSELSFFDLPREAFESVFGLNVLGTVLSCQVFGRQFAELGRGVILNVSSICGFRPLTNVVAYSAAKSAVDSFTHWLAVHMSKNYSRDIRVNALAPGFFLTEQNRFLLIDEETGDLTVRGQTIIDHTPVGRFGDPDELVGAVLWLVSSAATFSHGSVVTVDGGFTAFSGV